MTTGGVLLALGAIFTFIASVVMWIVGAVKKKSTKTAVRVMIASIIVMIVSFVLNKMYGYAITAVILALFFTFVAKTFFAGEKEQQELNTRIDTDPAWETEKKVRERLDGTRLGKNGAFGRYPSYMDHQKYYRYRSENQSICGGFLKDGALMVAAHQCVDPNALSNNSQALYVYTPNVTFKKWTLPSGAPANLVLPAGLALGIKEHKHAAVVTKDVSVTGSAIVGAAIGGTAGAVVGAVHAAETNAKGGKSKVVYDGTKEYDIQVFDHWIDCVVLSKEILKACPAPSKEMIAAETDIYWVLDKCLSGADKNEVEETRSYLNAVIAKFKSFSK